MTSAAEDNYLKAIYKIANYSGDKTVSTKSIAEEMQTSAPAVTDMLRKLAEKLQEIENKRVADNERIVKAIEKLEKAPASGARAPRNLPTTETPRNNPGPGGPAEKGYEYVIASGDTLSTIAQAYREKGVKVTVEQILKANPGLKEKSLKVGQKVFIPASQP